MVDWRPYMNVLFVCTGNVCRSPMAEGFLKREASERGLGLSVRSTGTNAWPGRAATIYGRRVMQELGTPIDDHRTLELTRGLLGWADLVIALAREHVREIASLYPEAGEKTHTLKEFVGLLPSLPAFQDLPSWIAAAHAARNGHATSDTDVDDPMGAREEAYQRVATEIQALVRAMAEGLEDKRVGGQR